ncbi:MAG: hypothetical protein JWM59_3255 [Verrucomicrobiales bacterium]|nr:hypothetical protein [Verrucomicrobiales bacterium]
MHVILNALSPAEAAFEKQALKRGSKRLRASPELQRELLKKLASETAGAETHQKISAGRNGIAKARR